MLIKQALDADAPLPDCAPATISHTLVHLLAALHTPLVPTDLQQQCCAAEDRDDGFAILEGVEGVHTNVSLVQEDHKAVLISLDLDWSDERRQAL